MNSNQNSPPQAAVPIDIIIVGGGIAGLATAFCLGRSGHRITVVEHSSVIEDEGAGAGIQLAPSKLRTMPFMSDYRTSVSPM